MLTESTYKGLSGVRGNSHAPFLGGGGAAMCRCYPTRHTGQHCCSQNQSSRKKKNSSSSRNNNISNRQMTGMKKQKPPSERPRNERGGASARPLSAPPARGLFPARADGHLSSRLPCVIRHANE
ncbi:hypothetical protein F2N26_20525 [Escherichia coli]|nr:hypothetical protein [Escherichia coli]